jgi:TatD DNase family protein
VNIIERVPEVFAAVGVHPHDAGYYDDFLENRLWRLLEHPKVVALGEIGLDYFYDNSPREVQRNVFQRQLAIAREKNLPVVIHTREAEQETASHLEENPAGSRGGVLHCFSGSADFAQSCLEHGYLLGLGGMLTFKKAADLRRVAASLPLDRILLETDSPYLAPVPKRGKRNEPAFVRFVARQLAELKGVSEAEIGQQTASNFESLFRLDLSIPGKRVQ